MREREECDQALGRRYISLRIKRSLNIETPRYVREMASTDVV